MDKTCLPNFCPAWSEIPAHPNLEDFHKQLKYMEGEFEEVVEAVEANRLMPNNKNFAHIGEEVADVMLAGWTLLNLMSRMEECPCENFANKTILFCHLKNNRRGYHNDTKRI